MWGARSWEVPAHGRSPLKIGVRLKKFGIHLHRLMSFGVMTWEGAQLPYHSKKDIYIFSKNENVLVYYCKCCNLIGYATRYLFVNRSMSSNGE